MTVLSTKCRYAECHYAECRVFYCYAECHYAEFLYAEFRYAECCGVFLLIVEQIIEYKFFKRTAPRHTA
jgi:hypothetical protein